MAPFRLNVVLAFKRNSGCKRIWLYRIIERMLKTCKGRIVLAKTNGPPDFSNEPLAPHGGASEAAGPDELGGWLALLFTMRIGISTRHGTLGQMRGKFKRRVAHFPRFAGLARNPQLLPNDFQDVRESRMVPFHVGRRGRNAPGEVRACFDGLANRLDHIRQ